MDLKLKKLGIYNKDFNGLTNQIFVNDYKDLLYTIYNFAEEERYIHNLSKLGYDSDINSLEFILIDKVEDSVLVDFKHYIEHELQQDKVIVGVLLFKGKNGFNPIIIKPKNIDVTEYFNTLLNKEEN